MLEYKTTGIVRINGGIIGLSKKQADVRRHLIRPVKEKTGVYEILGPIELKAGETVRLENPDKAMLSVLELTKAEQARQAEAKEKARIKAEKEQAERLADAGRNGAIMVAARQAVQNGFVTAAGAPLVEAMETVTGFDVSAEERDAAWEEIKSKTKVESDKG